ncbi:integral membrane protein hemolysin-III homolog [Striga asiatica]|uniref:Integral membrane protein hemolysin-III homolog n=1 Tax=Striga asiatica TaxID=4170 RepID=A0A5A7QYP7_STRAF|nr:integral membrane protein hemolysin-III homolog [Striga asiatica]
MLLVKLLRFLEPKGPYRSLRRDLQEAVLGEGTLKRETDSRKSNICETQISSSHSMKSTPTHRSTKVNKSVTCAPDAAPLPMASSPGSSSTKFLVSSSIGTPDNATPAENSDHVHVNSTNTSPEDMAKVNVDAPWVERYRSLLSLLKTLDQSDKHEYLSRQAVQLEKQSMKLSMEEAKEIERVGLLDVLGERRKRVVCKASSSEQDELHK